MSDSESFASSSWDDLADTKFAVDLSSWLFIQKATVIDDLAILTALLAYPSDLQQYLEMHELNHDDLLHDDLTH